ncbi:MAG TPA: NYN domain-containing protein [Pyrinomonadaceae bacterium]|nr:NYN domain-containing protein [Pyrinomonadaceae bacterium]
MQHFDPTNNISWQLGHRGLVAVFIDGNNLFHAARFHNIDIDYNKLLRVLLGDGRLLRAFFYTGVDVGAERQQGFLLWMRRNGFRVVHKELKTFYDGTRKANLDVEIAVDMVSLAGRYDTAVLVSGDEDFVYAVNAVAYKGCRVEVAGFRSNTAPKLIDVADYFIDLGEIADRVRKEPTHSHRYYGDQDPHTTNSQQHAANGGHTQHRNGQRHEPATPATPQQQQPQAAREDEPEPQHESQHTPAPPLGINSDFVRVTDDQ